MSKIRELCPKTKKPCAAGCTTDTGVTGYCYEKDYAGDYRNPTLVERAAITSYILRRAKTWATMQEVAAEIERGEHTRAAATQPKPPPAPTLRRNR